MHDLAKEETDQDISLVTIETEKDIQRYDLDRLAQELTGKPLERFYPIYLVFHHGRLRGFFQSQLRACIYPAIHAELMHAEEYRKIMSSLIREIKRATGNPLFLVCERAEKFSQASLTAFGVRKSSDIAYECCEEI